jgi:hypothetical protein
VTRTYYLYGLRLRSEWALPWTAASDTHFAEVGLLRGSATRFATAFEEARERTGAALMFPRAVRLEDGETYLRWSDRFEFLVSADGRAIDARRLPGHAGEAFHTHLLGQVLSFALVTQGFDPLHATTVTIDGAAVAFLGESGFGKSSLAAAFLRAGHRVLTDDLLMLSPSGGGFVAHPGPPRIKLFPKIARIVLGPGFHGTPIATMAPKIVIRLGKRQVPGAAARLKMIYVLAPPDRTASRTARVAIRRASKRQACLALIRNTFNTVVTDPQRLSRQFAFSVSVASSVPIKRIAYPRTIAALARARDAILADVSHTR